MEAPFALNTFAAEGAAESFDRKGEAAHTLFREQLYPFGKSQKGISVKLVLP